MDKPSGHAGIMRVHEKKEILLDVCDVIREMMNQHF